jgi:DNA-binding transcriptional ArsR family regulator
LTNSTDAQRQGFTAVSNDFLWDPALPPTSKLIVLYIQRTSDGPPPSANEIADAIGVSRRTAERHLKWLRDNTGFIVQHGRGPGNRIRYTVRGVTR